MARFSNQGRSHCSPARSGGPSPRPLHPRQLILKIFWDSALGSFSLALPGLDFPKSWLDCGLISAQLGSVEFSSVKSNPLQSRSVQSSPNPVQSGQIQSSSALSRQLWPSPVNPVWLSPAQCSPTWPSPVQSNLAQFNPIQPRPVQFSTAPVQFS